MALFTSLSIPYGTVELSQANGPNFKVNGHRVKHYWRERTTLGSSRSPNFPQGSINPCDGSSIVTLNKRFVGGTPCLSVVDCPDWEDFSEVDINNRQKPSQNDKTEHGMAKDCAKSRPKSKMS
ncbi:hypothetical protein Tco_0009902 [Tanacetum coccineum]